VDVRVYDEDTLQVTIEPPDNDGGANITHYNYSLHNTVAKLDLSAFASVTVDLGDANSVYASTNSRAQQDRATAVINGIIDPSVWANEVSFDMGSMGCTKLSPSVTIDLKNTYVISQVTFWQYYDGDGRKYCAQRVALSTTGEFGAESIDIYNTGTAYSPASSSSGQQVNVDELRFARYVRVWSGGSNVNPGVHLLEVEIYGGLSVGHGQL
jgi:hypothetical protein